MEQFQHPLVVIQLVHRGDGGMAKRPVGLINQATQIIGFYRSLDKGLENFKSQRWVIHGAHGQNLLSGKTGQLLGYVETAVRRQTCQQDPFKIKIGGLSSGTDVVDRHLRPPQNFPRAVSSRHLSGLTTSLSQPPRIRSARH